MLVVAPLGYDDTPFLPGQKWQVRNRNRTPTSRGGACKGIRIATF